MTRTLARTAAIAVAVLALALPGGALAAPPVPTITERQTLPAGDGWASAEGGTTGGADAAPGDVHDVSTRPELIAALAASGDAPSIIRVHGSIPMNADEDGEPITCEEIAEGTGYDLDAYLEAYDPETWGTDREPEGEQEDARAAAAQRQRALIQVDVPAHTTIIGAEPGAGLVGASLSIRGVDDVIIRNLVLADTYDCFPAWDPTDGAEGNWNSEYDSVRIVDGATHVWVDHNAFTDAPMTDDQLPTYFGRTFQRHDGALDVTNGSDLVTVSWNTFRDHDKLTLVGSTDSPDRGDPGHLRVTFHHNLYDGVGQRAPRVRFGQVDVYNNSYVIREDQVVGFGYLMGVGYGSHLRIESNAVDTGGVVEAGSLISVLKGTEVSARDNLVDHRRVDLRAAYNAGRPAAEQLTEDTSWEPALRSCRDRVQQVAGVVGAWSGPRFGAAPGRIGADCRS
ncbi:polysaccharide lyase family 1 protein [Brachybacterium sp. NBEC-018]|uniref:pectate lyase family protein n=1 Tax=Brachybacterium sp. NBEC-018 TaxID=2996004 RepID=UPI00217509B1|nr:polysaccharide lyase family 1 protein [Brachybacterium sp. NBEC-018]UVY84968.1 polysaccharide lyase family 1 protein [Brachybacterium sp. NBEC-018]